MRRLFVLLVAVLFSGCASYHKREEKPVAELEPVSVQYGIASFYAGRWIGRKTASGEIYRAGDRTAAHRKLPFGTRVRVTDQRTGKSTIVRINNRGPYARGRVIDLSLVAAQDIGLTRKRGIAKVKLEVLPKTDETEKAQTAEKTKPAKEPRPTLVRLFAKRNADD